ncbi:hypothetical protein ACFW2Y_25990 [Streptomyces sp. NPDC058877]
MSTPPGAPHNSYGTFRLDMDKRLNLGLPVSVPHPRSAEATAAAS